MAHHSNKSTAEGKSRQPAILSCGRSTYERGSTVSDLNRPVTEPLFIDQPRDPKLRTLLEYWNGARGTRTMPRRADIDPTEIPRLLPHIVMYTVMPEGGYTIRLVGESIVTFVGVNASGRAAGSTMPPQASEILHKVLDRVVAERAPVFRAGKAHWRPDKSYRDFEACFLPLSADGEHVDIILCGITFSDWRRPEIPTGAV
jgi:hypothetical protein